MSVVAERRYQMTRVRAGDYILPSNDAETLWRIHSYEEYGDAEYQDADGKWHKVLGTFWATAKFNRPLGSWEQIDDVLDWEYWTNWHSGHRTRAEAIEAALERP